MTDEKKVVSFYNSLDAVTNLPLEVLDDLVNEAKEVHKHNRWLTYGLPLHRCRELGYTNRLFDLIDERRLTTEEMQCFCGLLFGIPHEKAPNTRPQFTDFMECLKRELSSSQVQEQWDPVKRKSAPLVNLRFRQPNSTFR